MSLPGIVVGFLTSRVEGTVADITDNIHVGTGAAFIQCPVWRVKSGAVPCVASVYMHVRCIVTTLYSISTTPIYMHHESREYEI